MTCKLLTIPEQRCLASLVMLRGVQQWSPEFLITPKISLSALFPKHGDSDD
jgi:hypothetical protein